MKYTLLLVILFSFLPLFAQNIEMDADTIRMSIEGVEKLRLNSNTLELINDQESVYIGEAAGKSSSILTNRNVGIGYQALENHVGGIQNVALGHWSLRSLLNGDDNIALGYRALGGVSNSAFNNNIAIGRASLLNHEGGDENIAIGSGAMLLSDSSYLNVAIGHNSLRSILDARWNVAVGHEAGYDNITGSANTYIGYQAGKGNNSADNVHLGAFAGENNLGGTGNLFLGNNTGQNSSGSRGIVVGHNSGMSNSGLLNIFIGRGIGNEGTGDRNIFIGSDGMDDNDNDRLVIDNGQNLSEPLIEGDFWDQHLRINDKLSINGSIWGSTKLTVHADPGFPPFTALINGVPIFNIKSNGWVSIGSNITQSDLHVHHENNSATAGFKLENEGINGNYWRLYVRDNNGNLRFYSKAGQGNGCGNNSGADEYVAWVDDCSGAWNSTSDRRKKKNFSLLSSVLPLVMQLQAYKYHYTAQDDEEKKHLGFVAQDLIPYFPELVNIDEETDLHTMNYDGLSVIALKGIQELKNENDALKSELADLKNVNEELNTEFSQLKREIEELRKLIGAQ
jgi:hypothetical protein